MALSVAHATKFFGLRFASITGITKDGEKKVLEFEDDQNLFELLTEAGVVSSEGTCMGNMACGKCKIKVVSGNIPAPEEEEQDLLEDAPEGMRLCCAITLNGDCDGAVIQGL